MAEVNFIKPKVQLVGQDGNIFNLIGICSKALKRAGYADKATEMVEKATHSSDYYEALAILLEYVDEDSEDDEDDEDDDEA